MSKNLLIVESPAKARTIEKYLGKDFKVLASYGHVRDLIPKEGAVDPEHDFAMKYALIEKNKKHVDAITKAAAAADALYLATDLDREGEAISWHVYEILKAKKGVLDGKPVHRVVFNEITPRAIREAVANPRKLSFDLIKAQQARRALDYLVGFNLSPLLWKKIARGLSAGRVQSPALRMIVEREAEIAAFEAREYWSIEADLDKDQTFLAKLTHYKGEKLDQFTIDNEALATEATETLDKAAAGKLTVATVTRKQRTRRPTAPFITSTLQQESSRKLRFSARNAMRVAQQLYEGVEIDGSSTGLITYMRTDSVMLANDAITEIREVIVERYGKKALPDEPNVYKTKAKNAQEAHEAIRPTSAARTPEKMKPYLADDQFKLYDLIWKRTMASQMVNATLNTVAVDMVAGDAGMFRATGSTVVDPGFMAVYQEGQDAQSDKEDGNGENDKQAQEKDEKFLPHLEEGETVHIDKIRPEQHFTQPPPRYTEATLVKTLEEYGIGRPSTYASIISTLITREYVFLENRRFHATDTGKIVARFLSEHFTQYVDYEFTAHFEDELDKVASGARDWIPLMHEFWDTFSALVKEKEKTVTREQAMQARTLGTDPKSGKPVSVRLGRYGPYAQIGTKDDDEKPKFAGLRPGQQLDTITFEEAMELFKLPRKLGHTADGEEVLASIGRYGPYIKFGDKYASMKEDDPYTVELPRALEIIEEKKLLDANRIIQDFAEEKIQVLNGRYGPYVTNGEKNARVPKDLEPAKLTLEECKELIAAAPARRGRGKKKAKKKAAKKTTRKAARKKTAKKAEAADDEAASEAS
ncbi:MAG: DNA topoisomerase I [Gammaproteobacteria bacterium]|nr:MAG: DNA topoisomerase I [Gammaproteobacteria bacterium]